ncbi:RHS repeat-associated core domain-containing protein [Paraburkholderia sp. EG287A]|uniref:RHS repeat-associated core domain-containing protein n=1 Tax=unclassified Paraburkholderia TaxID=2615204 RepID=UPI0034D1625E
MSTPPGNPASPANEPPPPPAPLISPTGNTSVDALASAVNAGAQPFQQLGNPKANTLDRVTNVVIGAVGSLGALDQLLNTGMAMIPGANLVPGMPAAFIGVPHLGVPHAHAHPPSDGVPMPSCGVTIGSGCLSVLYGGMPAARVLDIGLAPTCGGLAPIFEICTGSSNTFIGGARAARMALDLTRHCNPLGVSGAGHAAQEAEKASALKRAMHIAGMAAPVASGGLTAADQAVDGAGAAAVEMTAAQTAADAIAMAMSNLMGKDPGVEPGMGTLIDGDASVLIGGFPMPDALAMLMLGWGLRKKAHAPEDAGEPKRTEQGECKGGHPVDVVRGTAENEFADYATVDAPAFKWERYYRSDWSERDGALGFGFRHSFQHELRVLRTRAIYVDGHAHAYTFRRGVAGRYEGIFAGYALQQQGTNRFVILYGSHSELTFERTSETHGSARLVRHVCDGAESTLRYADDGTLRHIEQSAQRDGRRRLVDFIYDAHGHVVQVRQTNAQGAVTCIARYRYDAAGCLTAATDALGASMTYGYDELRRMTRETDANGYSFYYRYGDDGRCVESVGQDGLWRILLDYQPGRTAVTQADGGKWTYLYDDARTVTHIIDPYGGAAERVTGTDGRIVEEVDAGGRVMRWLYDERGRHTGRMDEWGNMWPAWNGVQALPNPFAHRLPQTHLGLQWGEPAQHKVGNTILLPEAIERIVDDLPGRRVNACALKETRDASERLVTRIDECGKGEHFAYDSAGNVLEYRDKDGRGYRYGFASWNLCVSEEDPLGGTVSYRYTTQEKVSSVVDANGNESLYAYDLKNRIVGVTRHGMVRETYAYDGGDSLVEKRDGHGNWLLRFEVSECGLHRRRVLASGETHCFEYDERGNFTRASTDRADVRFTYDALGRCIADKRNGRGVEHKYIGARLAETTYFDRFAVRYESCGDGDMSIHVPGGAVHRLHQSADGKVLLRLANGMNRLYAYDPQGRCVARLTWSEGRAQDVHCAEYSYSATGELRCVIDSQKGRTEYRYDAAHRLVEESQDGWPVRRFEYDRGGNLVSTPSYPSIQCMEGNRLAAASRSLFRYDERNRLAEEIRAPEAHTVYRYNSMDLLVEVHWSDREEAWAAQYDGLCRRTASTIGAHRIDYYWDRDRLAAESRADGRLRLYVYPDEMALVPFLFIDYDSPQAPLDSGRVYYVVVNQVGLAEQIDDDECRTVWRARDIDPYGTVTVADHGEIEYNLRFPGHYYDAPTGLHYNRFRTYSPALCRYLQSDPVGQAGGVNLYAYTANPLVAVDIQGLKDCCGAPGNNHFDDCEHAGNGRAAERPPDRQKSKQQLDAERKDTSAQSFVTKGASKAGEIADDLHRQTDATGRGMCTACGDPEVGARVQNGQAKKQPQELDPRGEHLSGENMVALMEELGMPIKGHPADGDVVGRTNASHAEMLAGHDNQFYGREPNVIGISRPSCGMCRDWLRRHAQYTRVTHIVSDPEYQRIYHPDGTVDIYHSDGEYAGKVSSKVEPTATRQNYEGIPW